MVSTPRARWRTHPRPKGHRDSVQSPFPSGLLSPDPSRRRRWIGPGCTRWDSALPHPCRIPPLENGGQLHPARSTLPYQLREPPRREDNSKAAFSAFLSTPFLIPVSSDADGSSDVAPTSHTIPTLHDSRPTATLSLPKIESTSACHMHTHVILSPATLGILMARTSKQNGEANFDFYATPCAAPVSCPTELRHERP